MGGFKEWIKTVDLRPSRENFLHLFQLNSTKYTHIGSRLMASKSSRLEWGDMSSSDWDVMFNQYNVDTHIQLQEWGFELVSDSSHYIDSNFGSLYRHPQVPRLDLIGKREYSAEKVLWSNITPTFFFKHLWKSNPNRDPEKLEEHKEFIKDFFLQQVYLINQTRRTTDG